ncbi:hypothetical protein [Halostagnicola sp. A56]|uniref:hypothetical protein n=1 Tax=Halostagnicola sp. A56 TaxID=1495067 RepID=UPI0006786D2F|nr:hypothetical protein [Halostagnicola sp. A56]
MNIYNLEFEGEEIGPIDVSASPDVAEQSILQSQGSAETVTGPTKSIGFTITIDGANGRLRAVEAQELLSDPAFSPVSVSIPAQPDLGGYYAASSVDRDVTLSQPKGDDHHSVPVTLSRVGSQGSVFRAIEINEREADHEFGNSLEAYISIPAEASKARWFTPETGQAVPASSMETVETAIGAVDRYAIENGDTLIYEVEYADDDIGDCRVVDGDSLVFDPMHNFEDTLILDNGLIRFYCDVSDGSIEAEKWDSAQEWTTVGRRTIRVRHSIPSLSSLSQMIFKKSASEACGRR